MTIKNALKSFAVRPDSINKMQHRLEKKKFNYLESTKGGEGVK